RLGEHARRRDGANGPFLLKARRSTRHRNETSFHFLNTHRERDIMAAAFDGKNCLAERGGSCCASIRDIENRYSPLANVAKDPLARKCDRLEGASAVQRLDIVDREAG